MVYCGYRIRYGGIKMGYITNIFTLDSTLAAIAFVLALIATFVIFILVVPEKRKDKLSAFGRFLHNTFNFKYLVVEKILQALYIFTTCSVILTGFFMLFKSFYGHWMGGIGILVMILGPIAVRLVYELLMMAVLLVKNVISINNKLRNQNGDKAAADIFTAPGVDGLVSDLKEKRDIFCPNCGSKLDSDGSCPNCKKDKI